MVETREEVKAAIDASFVQSLRDQALVALDRYGIEPYERERERVQKAIIELSGGNLETLSKYVEMAKVDYRDVLACQQLRACTVEEGDTLQAAAHILIGKWRSSGIRVGIQGELGSACDEAAAVLLGGGSPRYFYLTDAEQTLSALERGDVDAAVLAMESPVGVQIQETALALSRHQAFVEVAELKCEVRHCLLVRPNSGAKISAIASHEIPLQKHREFLERWIPGYREIQVADTGLAAKQLASGELSDDVAVIAMPRAAEVFGLKALEVQLPANDRYLTRFVLVVARLGP